MNILWLSFDIPYPLNSGGKIRDYYLMKNLAAQHKITLFSYYRTEDQKRELGDLKKIGTAVKFFKRRKVWTLSNLCCSALSRLPLATTTYRSHQLSQSLEAELRKNHYDWVYFDSFYTAVNLPLVKKLGVATILGNVNVESQLYQRYVQTVKFFPLRWSMAFDVWKMRRFEERLWCTVDRNTAVSENDARIIEKVTGKDCPVVPNGVAVAAFSNLKRVEDRQLRITFIGTLRYHPNNDAVAYFLEKIYPEIKRRLGDPARLRFQLVSWHKPNWLERYLADPTVEFVEDRFSPVWEFLARTDVVVAPMRVAGGTNIKILEAFAAGLPVVTTRYGLEGIAAKGGEHLLVTDDPQKFADRVVALLENPAKRAKIGKAAARLVRTKYDWQQSAKILDRLLASTKRGN